jgi:hypothetical protein
MVLRVLDPAAQINKPPAAKPLRGIASLEGRRVGLLWGRHAATVRFWPVFEEAVLAQFKPSQTIRLYKKSTWNPATLPEVEKLATEIDYALIGVGA